VAFAKGNKIASGGKRQGSGRKPEDFKTQLARLNTKDDILGQVRMMAKGQIEVSDKVRLSASLWLLEMEHGKPTQALEHSGTVNTPIHFVIETYDPKRD
jgi:hypothetical protein